MTTRVKTVEELEPLPGSSQLKPSPYKLPKRLEREEKEMPPQVTGAKRHQIADVEVPNLESTNGHQNKTRREKRKRPEPSVSKMAAPLDNIIGEMEKTEKKMKKEQVKREAEPGTPEPGTSSKTPEGPSLTKEWLETRTPDEKMVSDFLQRDTIMEYLLGRKMAFGRLEAYHLLGFVKKNDYEMSNMNGFRDSPRSFKQEQKLDMGTSNRMGKGPKTPPGSPGKPPLPGPESQHIKVLENLTGLSGDSVEKMAAFFQSDTWKTLLSVNQAWQNGPPGSQPPPPHTQPSTSKETKPFQPERRSNDESVQMELVSDCSLSPGDDVLAPPPPPPVIDTSVRPPPPNYPPPSIGYPAPPPCWPPNMSSPPPHPPPPKMSMPPPSIPPPPVGRPPLLQTMSRPPPPVELLPPVRIQASPAHQTPPSRLGGGPVPLMSIPEPIPLPPLEAPPHEQLPKWSDEGDWSAVRNDWRAELVREAVAAGIPPPIPQAPQSKPPPPPVSAPPPVIQQDTVTKSLMSALGLGGPGAGGPPPGQPPLLAPTSNHQPPPPMGQGLPGLPPRPDMFNGPPPVGPLPPRGPPPPHNFRGGHGPLPSVPPPSVPFGQPPPPHLALPPPHLRYPNMGNSPMRSGPPPPKNRRRGGGRRAMRH